MGLLGAMLTLPCLIPRPAVPPRREARRGTVLAVAASQLKRSFQVRPADRERCSVEVQLDFERKGFLKVSELFTQVASLFNGLCLAYHILYLLSYPYLTLSYLIISYLL